MQVERVIEFECPKCKQKLKAEEASAGDEKVCPKCGAAIVVPGVRDPTEVILLVHGIRTRAHWQDMVARVLGNPTRKVWKLKYGFFDAVRFWCPWTRKGVIEKVERDLREAHRRHPQARLSVVAHSYGTYAIGQILQDKTDINLHRLILCGSVIESNFRWDKVTPRVSTEVVNDCGDRDIWPVWAQSLSWGYGASGTYGFGTVGVHDRYHAFKHSDFFTEDFVRQFWLPWFDGHLVPAGDPRPTPYFWNLFGWKGLKYAAIGILLATVIFALLFWWLYAPWYPGDISALVRQYEMAEGNDSAVSIFRKETSGRRVRGNVTVLQVKPPNGYIVNANSSKVRIHAQFRPSVWQEAIASGTQLSIAGRINSGVGPFPIVITGCWQLEIISAQAP